jgi:hypothetical protein
VLAFVPFALPLLERGVGAATRRAMTTTMATMPAARVASVATIRRCDPDGTRGDLPTAPGGVVGLVLRVVGVVGLVLRVVGVVGLVLGGGGVVGLVLGGGGVVGPE